MSLSLLLVCNIIAVSFVCSIYCLFQLYWRVFRLWTYLDAVQNPPAKSMAVPNLWRSFGLKSKNWCTEPSSRIGGGHETSSANILAAFTALLLPSLFYSTTLPSTQQPPLPSNPLLLRRHFSRPPPLISSVACASPEPPPVHGIPQSITRSYHRLKGHILPSLPS